MQIPAELVLAELDRQFPKELQIAILSVRVELLEKQIEGTAAEAKFQEDEAAE